MLPAVSAPVVPFVAAPPHPGEPLQAEAVYPLGVVALKVWVPAERFMDWPQATTCGLPSIVKLDVAPVGEKLARKVILAVVGRIV